MERNQAGGVASKGKPAAHFNSESKTGATDNDLNSNWDDLLSSPKANLKIPQPYKDFAIQAEGAVLQEAKKG